MSAIGLRATPHEVHYAVIRAKNKNHNEVINVAKITYPKSFESPQKLKHLRDTLNNLIKEYQATTAGVRLIENTSRTKDSFRLNAEGVIQETLASAALDNLFSGTIIQIGAALNEKDKKRVKKYIDGEEDFSGMPEWSKYSKEAREAILVAVCSQKGEK